MADESTKTKELAPSEVEKNQADAEKSRVEAVARKAESDATVAKLHAETRKLEAEARDAAAKATMQEINARDKERDEKEQLAKNEYHHIYHFESSVDDSSVAKCIRQLNLWIRNGLEKDQPIEIIFTSPGGGIIAGFVLYDYIQKLRREGYVINTGTLGMAASMAGILLQSGNTRWMGKEAWVLIHQASFGAGGSMGAVEDTVLWVKRIQERIVDIFSQRAAVALAKRDGSISDEKAVRKVRNLVKKNWERRDWWLSSDECLKYGFVDEVR